MIKVFESMFSKECCHILNIQFELFHVLVINACQSQDDCSVSFYPFPYTVISIVMTSPGECHSVMWGNHCLFDSRNRRELQLTPYCQTIEKTTKMPKWNKLWSFQKQRSARKALNLRGRNSRKVIAKIQILKTALELNLYKD